VDDQVLAAVQFSVDSLRYAPFSLRPDTNYTVKWEPRDVVRDVIGTITNFAYSDENALYANAIEGPRPGTGRRRTRSDPACPVVHPRGHRSGSTSSAPLTSTTRPTETSSGWSTTSSENRSRGRSCRREVSLSKERPSKINVYFTSEHELRFDFVEGLTTTRDADDRYLVNVMPLPVTLTYTSGELAGQTLAHGTWVEINDDLFTAMVAAFPPTTPAGQTLAAIGVLPPSLSSMRKIWCNGGYNIYCEAFAGAQGGNADPVWANFLKDFRTHYRQMFRVNRRWADRVVAWLPRRVALLDPVNNVWGRPAIYANYALIPSYRRIGRKDGDPTFLAYNRQPFADGSDVKSVTLASIVNQQAQAALEVVDPQLGIFHISYFTDTHGDTFGTIPSCIEGYDVSSGAAQPIPSANIEFPLTVMSHCRLKDYHGLSLVLTAITGAPNDLRQTWRKTVELREAIDLLPGVVANLVFDADGPEMEVHVGTRNALFAWSDAKADDIHNQILGIQDNRAALEPLLINDGEVNQIARATAASIYAGMVDHLEGEPVVAVQPNLHPVGRVGFVEHGLRPDGTHFTKVNLPAPRQSAFSVWSLLPEWVRRRLRGIPNQVG
jgi:hypothetical protein